MWVAQVLGGNQEFGLEIVKVGISVRSLSAKTKKVARNANGGGHLGSSVGSVLGSVLSLEAV